EGAGASADVEASAPTPGAPTARAAMAPNELAGVVAVTGFPVGRVARLQRPEIEVSEAGKVVAHESAEFERARALVRGRLSRVADVGGTTRREIIATHLAYLDDPV